MRRGLLPACFVAVILTGLPTAVHAIDEFLARSGFFGPRIPLRYAKPTFRWEIWADKGAVTSIEMQVNGQTVAAKYDAATRSLSYTPLEPLPPGVHKVHCKVTFDNQHTFSRDWDAPVGASAVTVLPEASPGQQQVFQTANELRATLGLPPFIMDDRLNAAAQGHATYLAKNNMRGHGERLGDELYTGADPSSRLEALGWGGSSWEALAYTFGTDREAIRNIFDAPYHRVPFMQPGNLQFGYGSASQKATAEIEGTRDSAVVVSPAEGQTQVAPSWAALEKPNPLEEHPDIKEPVGYPIVVADFEPGKFPLTVQAAHLYLASGMEVPCVLNTAANDSHLTNALILIPVAPLKANAGYKVSIQATSVAGKPLSVEWAFTTGASTHAK